MQEGKSEIVRRQWRLTSPLALSNRLFLNGTPLRVTGETVLLFGLLIGALLLLSPSLPFYLVRESTLFLGPFVLFAAAMRLKVPRGGFLAHLRFELLMAPLLLLITGASALFIIVVQEADSGLMTAVRMTTIGFLLYLFLFGLGYGFLRLGVRLWQVWDRLRRRHLLWSLTHTHIAVVVVVALPFVFLLAINAIQSSGSILEGSSLLSLAIVGLFADILPVLAVSTIVIIAAVVAILPPSALVSFIVARQTTRRLETLATATAALRAGDLSARVKVAGEDEVAQLQQDFNGMAADLERAMAELQAERDRVGGLLDARRELVASASHELRTPIATLRGYLDSMQSRYEGGLPPAMQQDLQVMEREGRRLQRLVDDLFSLSRAEVGRLTLQHVPVDVGAVIQHCVTSTSATAWQGGRVQVVASVPEELPRAMADVGRLEQVLFNLLHNAIRHTPPGGIVAVVAALEAGAVQIEVRDTGTGIAPSDLPRIWEPFYRGSGSDDSQGTGLGLALVKELTEAMGGEVSVESAPRQGSCFTIRLKAAANDATPQDNTLTTA